MKKECLSCDYYQMMKKGKFYPIGNWTVYKHTTPSGKVYIGITSQDPKYRWNNGNGYKENKYFYKAIKKYGWDNIKHEIMFINYTKNMAILMEQCLITLYNSFDHNDGYNLTLGGETSGLVNNIKVRCLTTNKIFDSISEASRYYKINAACISNCCRKKQRFAGKDPITDEPLIWMFEEDYLLLTKDEIQEKIFFINEMINNVNNKKIRCLNTKKMFNSIKEASQYMKINAGNISACCRGKYKFAGRDLITDEPLIWMFEEDYLLLTKDEIQEKLNINKVGMTVICLNTKKKFDSFGLAAREYNIQAANIGKCCRGERRFAGKDPITGEPLIWMFEEDYSLLNEDEIQEKILLTSKKKSSPFRKKVRCLTTNELFNSVTEAGRIKNITVSCIGACCRGERRFAGKDPITGEPLKWAFYDENSEQHIRVA